MARLRAMTLSGDSAFADDDALGSVSHMVADVRVDTRASSAETAGRFPRERYARHGAPANGWG
jgi:hypothetical protein